MNATIIVQKAISTNGLLAYDLTTPPHRLQRCADLATEVWQLGQAIRKGVSTGVT